MCVIVSKVKVEPATLPSPPLPIGATTAD